MAQKKLYPPWNEILAAGTDGPTHQNLIDTDGFKAVLVGLQAGEQIPPHHAAAAAYHILEGNGSMIVDGERLTIEPGVTVVVPAGIPRGVEAETKLSFLGSHGTAPKNKRRLPLKMGFPVILGATLMFGLMIGWMVLPAQMMSRIGDLGLGMLGVMLLPILGMAIMVAMMFFFYRRMVSVSEAPVMMLGHHHAPDQGSQARNNTTTTLAFNVPSVNCGHCKMTIERAVGAIHGVVSVRVDVENKQTEVQFGSPATQAEIEAVLEEVGHPTQG